MTEQATLAQPATLPAPEPPSIITFRGERLDYSSAIPLKAGDWRRLKAATSFDIMAMGNKAQKGGIALDDLYILARAVLSKVVDGGKVLDEDLDECDFQELQRVATAAITEAPKKLDRPISTGSSPSPNGGAGGQTISAP